MQFIYDECAWCLRAVVRPEIGMSACPCGGIFYQATQETIRLSRNIPYSEEASALAYAAMQGHLFAPPIN